MTLMLEGAVDDRDLIITGLREQLRQVKEELAQERSRNSGTNRGLQELRKALTPLYGALQRVFGELDGIGVAETPTTSQQAPDSGKSAVWDSWKKKLGGKTADAIDALMLHGEMTAAQLKIHLRCGNDYVYNVVSNLNKAQLINKRGGKISLKEL